MPTRFEFLIAGVAAIGAAGGADPAAPARADRRARFHLKAQFGSGEGNWRSWTVEIDGEEAKQEVHGDSATRNRLTAAQVERLMRAVREARFDQLSPVYAAEGIDGPTLILTVTEGGRRHEVAVHEPPKKPLSPDLARFHRIWRLVLELVPSPNPGQNG